MTQESLHQILDLYDLVMEDTEYVALHREYIPAQEAFADLLRRLPDEDGQIVENYLCTSVALFHRLLETALSF